MTSPLEYLELLNPKGVVRILSPNYIPIHHSVYDSFFAFTQEYVDRARAEVPKSLQNDIQEIERMLGRTGLRVTDTGVEGKSFSLSYDGIVFVVEQEKYIELAFGSSNIALDKREGQRRELQLDNSHPMSRARLGEYAFDIEDGQPKIHTWYVHNHLDHGLPLELYFRNFAIMFNNLGIREL